MAVEKLRKARTLAVLREDAKQDLDNLSPAEQQAALRTLRKAEAMSKKLETEAMMERKKEGN